MPENNTVTFNSILVNAINTNSGIFVGTNSQGNWNSNNNNKFGFGMVLGTRNVVSRAVNIFMDNDFIDTPIITSSYNGVKQPIDKKARDNITIIGCHRTKKEQP
jgi:hypothetical protein